MHVDLAWLTARENTNAHMNCALLFAASSGSWVFRSRGEEHLGGLRKVRGARRSNQEARSEHRHGNAHPDALRQRRLHDILHALM
ncbi:hypothetical protein [Ramlibacter rhizophilus]|uniref:hypothetical protein n=1 Tax=Ramlibacter rhizophilus TaxID=1781167 RepID=UPI001F113904|nr:hypothetical protein [Ramlibacter rhizophilus]